MNSTKLKCAFPLSLIAVLLLLLLALGSCVSKTPSSGEESGKSTETAPAESYTVRILNPDGSELHRTTGEYGTPVVYLPERTGYRFGGYYSNAALTALANFSGTVGSADLDLYVKWEPISYTIRFDSGRAVGEMEEISAVYDERVTLPDNAFMLRGESFEEWQLKDADGTVTSFVDGARVRNLTSKDGGVVTLTAVFDNLDSSNFIVENGVVIAYNGTSTKVRLPQTATAVSADVFKSCVSASAITKLEVPACYTEIAKGAFAPLTGLTEVRLPFIGGSASENPFFAYVFGADSYRDNHFSFAAEVQISSLVEVNSNYDNLLIPKSLKKVVITNPVYTIAEGAFYHAYSLEKIVVLNHDDLYEIGTSAFEGCIHLGYDSELDIANPLNWMSHVETIGDRAFAAYISEENSEGSSYIFTRLFQISALEQIETIGKEAFYGCVYLLSLQCGDQLKSIGDSAFVNCVSLTQLTFPDSLATIGEYAFTSCSGLTEVTLGTGLSSLGSFAFADCSGLAQVTLRGAAPADVKQIPFSNGLDYATDITGSITGYVPVFDALTLYVETDALESYRTMWVDYADLLDTKQQHSVYYWGANSDGSYAARFELRGGNLAYVTDTGLEFLDLIDWFSDFYNTFRSDLEGESYTLTFEEVVIPDSEKRGDERFFRISNPQIVDALGAPTSFLVRIRPERYEKDGSVYYVPTLEWVDSFFDTVGDRENSLVSIERDEWGHYIFSTRSDLSSEFSESMPEGAAYGEYQLYYILAYTEKMVGMNWYDAKGVLISTEKYLVCNNCLYPCQGEDALQTCFTDYPYQILLDGKGNALLSLYESGSFTEYLGTYSVAAGQMFGNETLTVNLSNLTGTAAVYNGIMKLEGFFGGSYHRCELSVSSASAFVNQTLYTSADQIGVTSSYADDGSYYIFYDYCAESGVGEAHFAEYYDGSVSIHGVYARENEVLTITIPGYRPVTGYVDDMRGSFHIDTAFGRKTYSVYDDWENATFYMEEEFVGVMLTYYIVKMDGYGNAMFYDGHDDGFDNWYIGTYYNTHEVIGSDENGDFEIYFFTGVECDANGNILKNGKTFSAYYVTDTIVYDDEDEEGNVTYSGALLSVSSTTDSQSLTAYDERGLKFADLSVSPFGVVTLTVYDTVYENGAPVSTVNEELTAKLRAVAYQTSGGKLVYIVVFDAAGNYMFRIAEDENGDWVYEYEGEPDPQEALDSNRIFPDVSALIPAD